MRRYAQHTHTAGDDRGPFFFVQPHRRLLPCIMQPINFPIADRTLNRIDSLRAGRVSVRTDLSGRDWVFGVYGDVPPEFERESGKYEVRKN